jgi:hypothetical protein
MVTAPHLEAGSDGGCGRRAGLDLLLGAARCERRRPHRAGSTSKVSQCRRQDHRHTEWQHDRPPAAKSVHQQFTVPVVA